MVQSIQPASTLPLYSGPIAPPPTPGSYPGPGRALLLRPGMSQYVLNNTAIGAGQSSLAVLLERTKSGFFYPIGFSVEIFLPAGGTLSAAVQTSDTDQDAYYVNLPNATATTLNAGNVARIEVTNYWALFARVNFVSAATATVKFTR